MKWNKRTKITATATSALFLTLLLASCSNDNNNINAVSPTQTPPQVEVKQDDSASNGTVNPVPELPSDEGQPSETTLIDDTLYEVTGHYIGAIDSNSIEVEVEGETLVFQLSDAFDYVISDFVEHSSVTITYTKESIDDGNYTQHIIHSIANAK